LRGFEYGAAPGVEKQRKTLILVVIKFMQARLYLKNYPVSFTEYFTVSRALNSRLEGLKILKITYWHFVWSGVCGCW
jgi:hypothetical protein